MNLNVVKPKPAKPKFKSLAGSMKMKPASTGSSVGSSVVQTVAQSLLSIAKTKGNNFCGCTGQRGLLRRRVLGVSTTHTCFNRI
jgi:hypothetical protein